MTEGLRIIQTVYHFFTDTILNLGLKIRCFGDEERDETIKENPHIHTYTYVHIREYSCVLITTDLQISVYFNTYIQISMSIYLLLVFYCPRSVHCLFPRPQKS